MSKATVVAMGNTKTCSYCRALDALLAKADMEELLPGADFIYADQAKDSKLYATWKSKAKMSGNIPVIAVFDGDGVLKGKFVARSTVVKPFTAEQIAAEIADLCDIAMCGDHAIGDTYGSLLSLPTCIAKGDAVCSLRYEKKK